MKLGYCTITWGGVVGHPVGVTSVKDLFYMTHGPMDQAVTDIAAAGYEGVEMFDGNVAEYTDRPEELRGILDKARVSLVSVYTGANFIYADILPDELHRIQRAAELASTFGAERLVVGGGARRAIGTSEEDYRRLGEALDRVNDIAQAAGLAASYHPHLTTIVENPDELERLMGLTRIGFCPDTAHLAAGGGDPAAVIRKYPDRIRHVHLKDYRKDPFAFLPLGQGELDFPDIIAAIKESGYDSWLMVELDEYDGDPKAAAEISRKYLQQLLP
ncbi:sugar phosphate isomerase/epimerase [Pseudarthrobacter sp. NamE5]|uniref:sugar phosphate isomerase/epimerase family protein n=1 Tax=Pseudarthrobacter sp. NamE5 TaxID=2576839 RepID=UPI00110A6215|nr:sugar phosphate isomerase/epimerase [Pseudarthrobacter sp. NamE5]TLM83506.1 TIM barrel protein [Pseudarthrobacter sp. NamE5]